MTWTKLLGGHDVQRHRTSKRELDDIRALVARDLADARVAGLSADRLIIEAHGNSTSTSAEGDLDGYAFDRRVTVRIERTGTDSLARNE